MSRSLSDRCQGMYPSTVPSDFLARLSLSKKAKKKSVNSLSPIQSSPINPPQPAVGSITGLDLLDQISGAPLKTAGEATRPSSKVPEQEETSSAAPWEQTIADSSHDIARESDSGDDD